MILRKKKIMVIQFTLLLAGVALLFLTYTGNKNSSADKIISKKTKSEISKKLEENVNF